MAEKQQAVATVDPSDPSFRKGLKDLLEGSLNHFEQEPIYWEGVLFGIGLCDELESEGVELVQLREAPEVPEVPIYLLDLPDNFR